MKQLNEYLINKQTKEKSSNKMFLVTVGVQENTTYFEIVDIISKESKNIKVSCRNIYEKPRVLTLKQSDAGFAYSYILKEKDYHFYLLEKDKAIHILRNYLQIPAKDKYWNATPVQYSTDQILDFIADLKEI